MPYMCSNGATKLPLGQKLGTHEQLFFVWELIISTYPVPWALVLAWAPIFAWVLISKTTVCMLFPCSHENPHISTHEKSQTLKREVLTV